MTLIHHVDADLFVGSRGISLPVTQTQAKNEIHLSI